MKMEKRELVEASIAGQKTWRVPVSAWTHMIPQEIKNEDFVAATLSYAKEFDWDWIKINNRATLFAEAWGNVFDLQDYDGVLARLVSSEVGTPPDLSRIERLDVSSGVFGEYLDKSLRPIVKGLNGVPSVQTVFSPLTTLAFIAGRPKFHSQTEGNRSHAAALRELIEHHPRETHAALERITDTLCDFAEACIATGADGIFFAIMLLARDGILSVEEYEEFGKPYDERIFKRVQNALLNILHICGQHSHFALASELPANAISWGSIGQGNPTLAQARKTLDKVLIGGIDEVDVLNHGTPEDILQQARESIISCGQYKTFLAPGCCIWLDTPRENLHALRRAAEQITF